MIAIWKQGATAVATELASLSLLDRSHDEAKLATYFLLHGVAAAVATGMAWLMLRRPFNKANFYAILLIYSFGFFIPGLGVVACVAVVLIASRFPKAMGVDRFVEIIQPKFMSTEKDKKTASDLRAGHARRILGDPRESVDTKLRVLIALQDMRPKVAIPMLQGLLGDPAEDIRLLAYSMMDAWEKELTTSLQQAQAQLEEAQAHGDEAMGFNANRRLSELYWQQVDTKLARGDLRIFALQQCKTHCEAALAVQPNAAGVWLLYSQALIELDMGALAKRTLKLAKNAGANEVDIAQLAASVAWSVRDYRGVAAHMSHIAGSNRVPYGLKQSARFWTGANVDVLL